MQKSFTVKSPINFADYGFFVKIGDILVHDTANNNRLTIYRNGDIVKAITQTPLGMAAMVKNGFLEEITTQSPASAAVAPVPPVKAPPKPVAAVKKPAPPAKPQEVRKPTPVILKEVEIEIPAPAPKPELEDSATV